MGFPGFDSSLDFTDVQPLQSLEAQRTPVPATTPAQTTPKSDVESGDPQRELLARILMSLGSIGGHQPPAFLTQELNQRAIDRRQDKTIQAAQQRQFANQQAIEQRQVDAEARKSATADAKAQKMGKAATDVNEVVVKSGIDALDGAMMMQLENHLITNGGWDSEKARKYVQEGVGRKWEQSKDGKTMIVTFNNGMPPKQYPIDTIEKIGQSIIQMRGTNATGIAAYQPEYIKQSVGEGREQLVEKPTVVIPGQQSQGAPAPGSIQLAGGPATTLTAGPTEPRVAVGAPPELGVKMTPEDSRLLSGTPYAKTSHYQDLTPEGSQFLQTARQNEQYRVLDQQAQIANQRYFAQLDARDQSKIKFAQDKANKSFASVETALNQLEELAPKLAKKGLSPTSHLGGMISSEGGIAQSLAELRRQPKLLWGQVPNPMGSPNDPDLRNWETHAGMMVSTLRILGDIGPRALAAYKSALALIENPPTATGSKAAFKQLRELIQAARTGEVQHVGLPGTTDDPTVPPTLRPTTPGIPLPGGRQSNDRAFGDR